MAKGRMMVYRLYVDDLEGGTQYMSNEEFGAYMRLLHYQFRYGSVPEKDFENIVNRGLTAVEPWSNQMSDKNIVHAKAISELLKKKFELRDEGYINLRMEETRNEAINYSERQSDRRKKVNRGSTAEEPRINRGSTMVEPHGNGNGKGILGKGGAGEKPFYHERQFLIDWVVKHYDDKIDDAANYANNLYDTMIQRNQLPPDETYEDWERLTRKHFDDRARYMPKKPEPIKPAAEF